MCERELQCDLDLCQVESGGQPGRVVLFFLTTADVFFK